jgi:hypothetical protein
MWRRVAERGATVAFTPEEISQALVPALEQDCRTDMTPDFISGIRRALNEPALFTEAVTARLEALRPQAGAGIGRALLDNVALLSSEDCDRFTVLQEAMKAALTGRAARGARQVEEHYLRKSSARRAAAVRNRLEEGIGLLDLEAIAARVLGASPKRAPVMLQKKGLDDGVTLP